MLGGSAPGVEGRGVRGAGGSVGSAGTGRRSAVLAAAEGADDSPGATETSSLGAAVGSADGSAEGSVDASPEGDADGSDVAGGVTGCAAITGRKDSRAVLPTNSTSESLLMFGTATSILSLPCTVTEASPTPRESTRFWMIVRAISRFSRGTVVPSGVRAVRVIVVPPRRSRPSRGVQLWVMAIRPNNPSTTRKKMTSVRAGR